jgi:TIR domain/PAN domain
VADIFFSYSSQDRERVRRVRDALVDKGFDVFWDQQTPAGIDWDTWIRGELGKAKCAVVCWSAASAASDNVRHEATVAKRQGKLISVFLEPLTELDIPLGLYAQQAANLASWNGDYADDQWRKFRDAVEAKLTPPWVQEKIGQLDAELEGERVRRESAEVHEKAVRAQISKEAKIQQDLKRERNHALTEVGELRAAVEDRDKALQAQIAKQVETEKVFKSQCDSALTEAANFKKLLQERDATLTEQTAKQTVTEQDLKTERDRALAEVAGLKTTIAGLTRVPPNTEAHPTKEPTKQWLSPVAIGMVLLAAVLGAALASLSSSWNGDAPVEANAAQTTAALAKSEQARQAAEARADQATAALGKSEQARQAAEAKAAEAEKARQATEAKATQAIVPPSDTSGLFTISNNMEARGVANYQSYPPTVHSIGECAQTCSRSNTCRAFAYRRNFGSCYTYSKADLVPNVEYDSGVRR